ncbi:hypothetical protein JTE90_012435 [Oedothorax gibbosus]|uniref:Uncharacterized protein n=1 Tax=Oedothorax gibbosus TaxID=931172 RepID=A0AAV6TP29_9ARAC|nr:hypothetical protein JTE90_012435 [Oedothorax gibbosus]
MSKRQIRRLASNISPHCSYFNYNCISSEESKWETFENVASNTSSSEHMSNYDPCFEEDISDFVDQVHDDKNEYEFTSENVASNFSSSEHMSNYDPCFEEDISDFVDQVHDDNNENEFFEPIPVLENGSNKNVKEDLAKWAVKYNVPLQTVSALLKNLQNHLKGLPIDARSLLKTPREKHNVVSVQPGNYLHFGLDLGIKSI